MSAVVGVQGLMMQNQDVRGMTGYDSALPPIVGERPAAPWLMPTLRAYGGLTLREAEPLHETLGRIGSLEVRLARNDERHDASGCAPSGIEDIDCRHPIPVVQGVRSLHDNVAGFQLLHGIGKRYIDNLALLQDHVVYRFRRG